jgi:hypothetical protein
MIASGGDLGRDAKDARVLVATLVGFVRLTFVSGARCKPSQRRGHSDAEKSQMSGRVMSWRDAKHCHAPQRSFGGRNFQLQI